MADPNYLSYVVPGTSDQPGGYQELLARKAIAEALAKKREFPKNIGEGIFSASESLANAIGQRDALDAGRRYFASGARTLGDIPDTPGGDRPPITYQGGDSAPTAPAPALAPAPAPAGPSPWTADNEAAVRGGSLFGQSAMTPYAAEDAPPAAVSPYAPAGTTPGQATTARGQLVDALAKQRFASAFSDTAPAGEGGSVPFNGAPVSTGAPSNLPVVAQDDEGNPPIRTDIPAAPAADNLLTQPVPTTKPLTVARQPNPIQPLPLYPEQRKALAILSSPDWGPDVKEAAKRKFDVWEKYREEQQALMHAEYTRAQQQADEYDKAQRTVDLKDYQERQTALRTQQQNVVGQNQISQLPITNAQAAADLQQRYQELSAGKAPPMQESNGRLLMWDQNARQMVDITPNDPFKINPTPDQRKDLANYTKAAIAMEQYDRIPNADKLLAEGLKAELEGRVPFVGNSLLSARYQAVRNAAQNLIQAHLRDTSGAVIGPQEMITHHAALIPIYGDKGPILDQKREQRQGIVNTLYLGLGNARPIADYNNKLRADADAAAQAKLRAEMPANPVPMKIYKDDKTGKRRFWTGTRWMED